MPEVLHCRCGQTRIALDGAPFVTATCFCNSCRRASERLAVLPVQPPMADAAGGTAYRLFRKDRAAIVAGVANLAAFRLSPEAPTRRVIATCCNTPMFTEFESGHWLSLYNGLWPDAADFTPQILTQTGDAPDPAALPAGIPHGAMTTAGFYGKLLLAWVAMGFRAPKIEIKRAISA